MNYQKWLRLIACALFASQLLAMSYLAVRPASAVMPLIHTDKALHFIAYFTLMIWPFFLIKRSLILFLATISIFLYGVIIELVQAAIPNRFCSIADMAANLSGIIVFTFTAQSRIMQQAKKWLHD